MQSRWRAAPLAALIALFSALTLSVPAEAQPAAGSKDFTPSVGQEGKDVIWVPTPQSLVDRMLQMADTKSTDFVIDLGAGDGRTVITAAKKFGARALGIEYNPDMVELAKRNAEKEGVAGRAQFIRADIFQTDFTQATVLTLYLLPSLNVKLRPTILNMKPGTRVVSHAFTMDDWQADQVDSSEGRTAYMWIVPAKAAGTWRIEVPASASV
ncbi:MAG: SAM-dependent methyltransferase, partial [Burkholderiales bacterium]